MSRGDFGCFSFGEILYRGDYVPGRLWVFLIWGDFVTGSFCNGELLYRGDYVRGDYVRGDFVPGRFWVRGDFVPGRLWVVIL